MFNNIIYPLVTIVTLTYIIFTPISYTLDKYNAIKTSLNGAYQYMYKLYSPPTKRIAHIFDLVEKDMSHACIPPIYKSTDVISHYYINHQLESLSLPILCYDNTYIIDHNNQKINHPDYRDIEIYSIRLTSLPENGSILDQLLYINRLKSDNSASV